ncbi:putative threonine efflux protein [Aquitalea magnusonii]|uniref:Putative threonine efflux protein n=1 Tax=Aquitalea magnusonii TaxID=332411 RepID=A0A3G9GGY5_9NEIS|nr:LysE family transporter [Aquitalea magnusonii]BBF85362.1 putative threonine efflux protein [Aquitalea magnusonii]
MLAIATKGFLLSVSLCLDIGIVNAALINTGLRKGLRPALMMGLGSCFGDLFYALLSLLGMSLLFGFTPVRWVMWLGGGSVLLWLSWKMARAAWHEFYHPSSKDGSSAADDGQQRSTAAEFWRGLLMALASPSSLLWFAAVGGSIIAQSTDGSSLAASVFLGGFFLGGLAWSSFLAWLASHGQKLVGHRLLLYCNAASAALFAYLALGVIVHGYQTLL